MKKILMVALTMFLAFVSVQDVAAQGFWKKLGKAAEKVLNSVDTSNSTTSSSLSSSTNSNQSSVPSKTGVGSVFTFDGISVKITGCEHWGDDVIVRVLMTNNNSSEVQVSTDNVVGDPGAVDPDGASHRLECHLSSGTWSSERVLPAGVPVKGYFKILNYDKKYTTIPVFKFVFNTPQHAGVHNILKFEARNLPVTLAKNTNFSNIYCSLPTLYVQYNNCTRVGNTVNVNVVLKNLTNSEQEIDFNYGKHAAYDADGNTYTPKVTIANRTMQPEIPVKATVAISNVPTTVDGFSYIKICFGNYYIEMRNINFK